jgi:hypothetical protein
VKDRRKITTIISKDSVKITEEYWYSGYGNRPEQSLSTIELTQPELNDIISKMKKES